MIIICWSSWLDSSIPIINHLNNKIMKEYFRNCANKSVSEIKSFIGKIDDDLVEKCARLWLSRHLAFDDNSVECRIFLEPDGSFGIGVLQMPLVKRVYMDKTEGWIGLYIEGYDEPLDFDELSLQEKIQLIDGLEKIFEPNI